MKGVFDPLAFATFLRMIYRIVQCSMHQQHSTLSHHQIYLKPCVQIFWVGNSGKRNPGVSNAQSGWIRHGFLWKRDLLSSLLLPSTMSKTTNTRSTITIQNCWTRLGIWPARNQNWWLGLETTRSNWLPPSWGRHRPDVAYMSDEACSVPSCCGLDPVLPTSRAQLTRRLETMDKIIPDPSKPFWIEKWIVDAAPELRTRHECWEPPKRYPEWQTEPCDACPTNTFRHWSNPREPPPDTSNRPFQKWFHRKCIWWERDVYRAFQRTKKKICSKASWRITRTKKKMMPKICDWLIAAVSRRIALVFEGQMATDTCSISLRHDTLQLVEIENGSIVSSFCFVFSSKKKVLIQRKNTS